MQEAKATRPADRESRDATGFEIALADVSKKTTSFSRYALLILPGFFFAGDRALWHWSIHYTTVANSTLLTNFAPIFVTIVAYYDPGERFDRRFPLGLALALGGAALLIRRSLEVSPAQLYGDILGILTALFYAACQFSVKRLRRDFSTLALMFGSSLTGAVMLLAAAANGWGALFGLALISHIAGQGLIAYAFAHLHVSFSSVSLLLQPIVATIGAYLLFDEAPGPLELQGAAIVLTGVILARLATRGPEQAESAR